MTTPNSISKSLDQRRKRLKMSKTDLAKRAQVSLPTVRRLLSHDDYQPGLNVIASLASALGVEVRLGTVQSVHELVDVTTFRTNQARKKARQLARLVQGTMALEADAVAQGVVREIENESMCSLISGSPRRLWSK